MSGAATQKAVKFTSAFRLAGLNYLEALTVQTNALRRVMKEPMRSEVRRATQTPAALATESRSDADAADADAEAAWSALLRTRPCRNCARPT